MREIEINEKRIINKMNFDSYTEGLITTGKVFGAVIMARFSGAIWSASEDSLSAADCKTLWEVSMNREGSEITLREGVYKSRLPGSEEDILSFASGESGLVAMYSGKSIVVGLYDEGKGQDSESCYQTVSQLAQDLKDKGY